MKIPAQIINQLKENFSVDVAAFEQSHTQTVPVSVRLNPLKPACGFEVGKPVPWASNAYYLPERPIFTNDPLFHAGCYYVQEASSMFVEQAFTQTVDTSKPLTVLDACAAPGGKSTLLVSLLGEESLLVSNEVISTRVPVLTHNMAKWGTINSLVTNSDPHDFSRLPNFFDVMVVDAPCSGSGLFRKQEDAIEHWSEENVNHCSLRQQRILADLLPSLKQDGVLIYSTCSYSVEENESMCDYLCEQFSLETIKLKILPEWGITETDSDKHKAFGYRFFPHLAQGEGFFLACFKKTTAVEGNINRNQHKLFTKISADEMAGIKSVINDENLDFVKFYDDIVGFHKGSTYVVNKVASALKIKKLPLHIGQLKGKDFIPHPYLAYQDRINSNVVKVDTDSTTALQYLRKQPFVLSEATKGFTLLSYNGFNLGWFKNLGNRINNYYPAEWRILKEVF